MNGNYLSCVNFKSNGKYRVYITNCTEEDNEIIVDATKNLSDDEVLQYFQDLNLSQFMQIN